MKNVIWRITMLLLLAGISGSIYADYKTPEFNNKKSRTSTVYMCAVIGVKKGYNSDALAILAQFVNYAEISAQHSGELMSDALTWWETESSNYDLKGMWDGACAEPFRNMKRVFK